MSFQQVGALAWLAPIGAAILLLYLLKMRRREVHVPATFLWPARVEEVRANALFQKLRPNLLLLLQLLALLLVVVGLARPQMPQKGLVGDVTVIVIDSGASMSATDVAPSRFEEARKLARQAILSAKAGDLIALIEAGSSPRVVCPLINDPAHQLTALDTVEPTDAEPAMGDALRLAAALVGSVDGARIVLLSDGVFESISDFSRGKAALVYKCIGKSDENLAVTALGVADVPAGRQLYCGLTNTGSVGIGGVLSFYADGHVIDSINVPRIAPHSNWGRTIPAPRGASVFEAKLDDEDRLKSDNYAVAVADPNAALRVLLIGQGDPFLERALVLDPRVTLDRASAVPTESGSKYDLVVFDGVPSRSVAARGVLSFGPVGGAAPVQNLGSAKKPTFISSEGDRLLKGVDFAGVYIDTQQKVKAHGSGEILAESSAGPLVVVSRAPEQRQIYVAFEPLKSDFPLQVSFPIFVANALDFLSGSTFTGPLAVRAGQPFSIGVAQKAELQRPDGGRQSIDPVGSSLVVREVRRTGHYVLSWPGVKRDVYASMVSERQSNIAPVTRLSIAGGAVKATSMPLRFGDYWRPIVLIALLVLCIEWWVFARRS